MPVDDLLGQERIVEKALFSVDGGVRRVVAGGLSMPHSPRVIDGKLYVLEGGRGQVLEVDPASGATRVVAKLPGFTHGLTASLFELKPTTSHASQPKRRLARRFGQRLADGRAIRDVIEKTMSGACPLR